MMSMLASPTMSNGSEKPTEPLLELDPLVCDQRLGRRPFPLRHRLADHPLLTLDALARLAESLPVRTLECLPAAQEPVSGGAEPRPLPSPSETVLGIETNGCWMVMKNVERNPAYRELLDEVLDEMSARLPEREGGMRLREAFMFLSAPDSVTPVHIDPEHNVLLHVRGAKVFQAGKFRDRLTEQREIHRYQQGGHRNLAELPPTFTRYDLTPGDGLYMPPWVPHWVRNGPTYAISISVTFRTRRSERYEYSHMVNGKLLRLGLSPRPVGQLPWLDEIKASYVRGKRRLRLAAGLQRSERGDSG